MLHSLALHSTLENFQKIFEYVLKLDKVQAIKMLKEQASVKSRGTPLMLVLQEAESKDDK